MADLTTNITERVRAWIDENGIHIPGFPEVLEAVREDFRGIYGRDIYLEPDSQDGALCMAFAVRLYDCYTLAASVYNAYSPATAQGVGLSSVVKTNGIRRDKAGHSQAVLRVVGQAGTVIKSGVATDDSGQNWLLPEQVIIPVQGEVFVTATAEKIGALRAGPGEIRTIARPMRGWHSVTNLTAAVPGAAVQSDAALRQLQKISTAIPSLSILDGIKGAVASLPGVTRCKAYENDSDVLDKLGIPPHHLCIVVEGGEPQAIGEAIAVKKGPGCGTYGDVSVNTRDKYGSPATMRYFVSKDSDVAAFIRIKPLNGYLSTTGQAIRQNVAEYLDSLDIGDSILLYVLYSQITAAEPNPAQRTFDVLEIKLGPKGGTLAASNMDIAFNHAAACSVEDVELQEF